MQVPLLPAQMARALARYELNGAAHWSEVARAVNAAGPQGGHVREAATSFTLQAEPVAPTSLVQGQNTVVFSNPGGLPAYQVRNVRLVLEPFDGWNWAASAASNQGPAGSVCNAGSTAGWNIYPLNASKAASAPQLTVQLSQTVSIDALRLVSKALDGAVSVGRAHGGRQMADGGGRSAGVRLFRGPERAAARPRPRPPPSACALRAAAVLPF